jgi:hypothetical protein
MFLGRLCRVRRADIAGFSWQVKRGFWPVAGGWQRRFGQIIFSLKTLAFQTAAAIFSHPPDIE